MFHDELLQLSRFHDGRSPGPTQDPVNDLVQSVDAEAESDGAVLMTFDLLRGVPGGFSDEVGSIVGESDLNVISLVSAINSPGVSEVPREVEVGRNLGSRVEQIRSDLKRMTRYVCGCSESLGRAIRYHACLIRQSR